MSNPISNKFHEDFTNVNDTSSSQQQIQSIDIFSTIQHENTAYIDIDDSSDSSQPNEINQNESTSLTSISLQKEDVEIEIRRRMMNDEFWIWDSFKLIGKSDVNLGQIFKFITRLDDISHDF